MKKIISIVLSICMILCALPIQAFAKNLSIEESLANIVGKDLVTPRLIEKAKNDIDNLESVGFESNRLNIEKVSKSGEITYKFRLTDEIESRITAIEDSQGSLVLNIYEGTKHNELVYLSDGGLLVDGNRVEISFEVINEKKEVAQNTECIAFANARYSQYSTSPFVSSSTYTDFIKSYKANKNAWGVETIVNLTATVVAAILSASISGISVGGSIAISIFAYTASAMINYVYIYGMEDAYWSYEFDKYESTESWSLERHYKYTGACYSRRNQDPNGAKFPHTFYEFNFFS
ncbi:hypothetical protein HZF24_08245 [Sedimentibacter hydroxybenzoicus DSM 7310]|uniref:Uncharacterized protein n=1 Tax=Sedimentibacter hydroxybenzoicus DSM 7310 TaxID=1123245 RepID=A0A974BJY0_SEDHY|nr:hypothetical protein [Sedimentibacter hydroxybenzoicus]NYB74132.1 hypothetical protein [Sedimentibacter hydroxybenzoicus DSM 7310]